MQTIAVCEDETIWLDQLLQILQSIKTEGELTIHTFHSGEELLKDFTYGQFDLIFMDIYMKNLSGVEIVTRLRKIDKDVSIAFTTTSPDHALEAYRLNVMKYIEKPAQRNDVLDCLKLAQQNRSNRKQITLLISGREHSFAEEQLLYLEQMNHSIIFHLSDGTVLSCSGKIDDYSDSLPTPPFYHCHKSFFVNLANVSRIDQKLKVFVMKNGTNAYISRDRLRQASIKFDEYLFDKLRRDF